MTLTQDEAVLVTDTFVASDPVSGLRQRARSLIAGRRWSTQSISYGDQQEPIIDEYGDDSLLEDGSSPAGEPRWSFCFVLGLDHIKAKPGEWFADVEAILDFLQTLFVEEKCESRIEVRYQSKPWLSEHIVTVDEQTTDRMSVRRMIELVV